MTKNDEDNQNSIYKAGKYFSKKLDQKYIIDDEFENAKFRDLDDESLKIESVIHLGPRTPRNSPSPLIILAPSNLLQSHELTSPAYRKFVPNNNKNIKILFIVIF